MVVAVDAKKTSKGKWEIFTHGGRENTGIDAIDFSKQAEENGAGEILLTSMDKDGTKSGYDLELLKKITTSLSIPVIASGGAGKLEHLYEAIKNGGASAVLAASIFHYGEFTIKETKEYLKSKNVPIRL
jgi:cyclase